MPNQDIPDIVKLIHDLNCTDPDEMYFSVLADRVRYFKQTEDGQEEMLNMMDEIRQEAATARAEEIALRMLEKGYSVKEISECTDLSIEALKDLIANNKPQ